MLTNIPQAVIDALDDTETILFVTIEVNWPTTAGGTQYITDYPTDITIGNNTYSASQGLLGYSRPSARSVVSRNEFSFELENNDNRYNFRVDNSANGVPCRVFLHFQNPQTRANIGSIEIYSGISTSASILPRDGGQILRLNFAGELSNLAETRGRYTTTASQQAHNSSDTSMDYAHDPDSDLVLLWGRL